jgi:hypothetical protein
LKLLRQHFLKYINQTEHLVSDARKLKCNNFSNLPMREGLLKRIQYSTIGHNTLESWASLPGYDAYMVSSWGRVKHLRSYGSKPRLLIPTLRENKYFYVTLSLNAERKGFPVDRLVIMAFNCIRYSSIRSVKHVDGLEHNNQLTNLVFEIWET